MEPTIRADARLGGPPVQLIIDCASSALVLGLLYVSICLICGLGRK